MALNKNVIKLGYVLQHLFPNYTPGENFHAACLWFDHLWDTIRLESYFRPIQVTKKEIDEYFNFVFNTWPLDPMSLGAILFIAQITDVYENYKRSQKVSNKN